MRLISSLHSGPFSVSHRLPVCASKVNPYELRMPNAKTLLPAIGLPAGTPPAGVMRRILPRRLPDMSWEFELSWPSPMIA